MRRGLAAAFGLALIASAWTSAQSRPDFSGTWVLDKAKSQLGPQGGGRGAGPGRGGGLPTATEMVIKQTATEMTVDNVTPDSYAFSGNPVPAVDGVFRFSQKFLLDGKEFPANCPPCDAKGTATWQDGKLTISAKRRLFAGALGYIETEDRDVFSLSGNVLTLERTVDAVGGPEKRLLVYTKK
jgi:hypothetical protein